MTHNPLYKSAAAEQAIMALYDEALTRWPVSYETRHVATRHGDTFVIASGDESAPPLVLLHGAGSNSAIWIGEVQQYSRHHRVYAVDLLGEAGKSAPNRLAWDSPAYVAWLSDVLATLDVDQAALLGISLGGWTAMKFAATEPQRVTKLALMCPGGVVAARPSFIFRAVALSLLGQWGVRRTVRLLYASQSIPEGVEDIFTVVMSGFNARVEALPLFTDAELARLEMPTLLLWGSQDVMFNAKEGVARMRSYLPRLTASIIPGAGHVILDTVDAVMAFLRDEGNQGLAQDRHLLCR